MSVGPPPNTNSPWGKVIGLSAIGCVVLGALAAFFIFRFVNQVTEMIPGMMKEIASEETFPVSRPSSFDPFDSLAEISSKVGSQAKLVSIDATSVRSDGTMDLTAKYSPPPRATYEFVMETTEDQEKMPPVGAGRGPDDVWAKTVTAQAYRPGQRSRITKTGGDFNAEYSHVNEGVTIKSGPPRAHKMSVVVEPPKLTTKEMWDKAIELEADRNAVARISYDEDGYEFAISGTPFSIYWDLDGKFNERKSRGTNGS